MRFPVITPDSCKVRISGTSDALLIGQGIDVTKATIVVTVATVTSLSERAKPSRADLVTDGPGALV